MKTDPLDPPFGVLSFPDFLESLKTQFFMRLGKRFPAVRMEEITLTVELKEDPAVMILHAGFGDGTQSLFVEEPVAAFMRKFYLSSPMEVTYLENKMLGIVSKGVLANLSDSVWGPLA